MTKEEILAKLKFEVELRGLSKNTKDEYYTKVKFFQDYFDKPATELSTEHVRQFLHYLTTEKKLTFFKGCPGNLQGISRLVEGMDALDVAKRLKGIQCQNSTSCPDQLANAIELALMERTKITRIKS